MSITPAQLAEWRLALQQEGDGEFLDPTLAQQIAPQLMDELERAWARAAWAEREVATKEAAALEKRLADVATYGGECQTCHNAEARAVLARLRKTAGA